MSNDLEGTSTSCQALYIRRSLYSYGSLLNSGLILESDCFLCRRSNYDAYSPHVSVLLSSRHLFQMPRPRTQRPRTTSKHHVHTHHVTQQTYWPNNVIDVVVWSENRNSGLSHRKSSTVECQAMRDAIVGSAACRIPESPVSDFTFLRCDMKNTPSF